MSYNWRNKEHSHNTKFMDQDIAMHSIILTNIDKSIPAKKMSEIIFTTFDKLFPGNKVVCVKVHPRLDNLYKMA